VYRHVGAAVAVVVLLVTPGYSELGEPGDLDIVMVSVGQGDAFLIELPNGRKLLVDGGPVRGNDWSNPPGKLYAFLLDAYSEELADHGYVRVDMAIATHSDSDHINGISGLLSSKKIRIRRLYHNCIAPEARDNTWDPSFSETVGRVKTIVRTGRVDGYQSPFRHFLRGIASEGERGLFRFRRLSINPDQGLPKYMLGSARIDVLIQAEVAGLRCSLHRRHQ